MHDLVVTGGLGLIGSAIVDAWEGECALLVDDGRAAVIDTPQLRPEGWRWSLSTVEELADSAPLVAKHARAVIHCAAPVGPVAILSARVLEELVAGALAACRIAAASQAPLVMLSSSEVHGTTDPSADGSMRVAGGEWNPRREYALGKIAVELIAGRHRHETGLPTAIIRPWNVTGPRQSADKGFVLPRWAESAAHGLPLTVYGDGMAERAIMAVDDFAALVCSFVDGTIHPPGAWDAVPMEAATPANRTSMADLANLVVDRADVLGLNTWREFVDPIDLHGPLFAEAGGGLEAARAVPCAGGLDAARGDRRFGTSRGNG